MNTIYSLTTIIILRALCAATSRGPLPTQTYSRRPPQVEIVILNIQCLASCLHGVYIRHASGVQFTGITISAAKTDFRTAIVLDDVHKTSFQKLTVKEPESKKKVFAYNSSEITLK